MQRNLTFNQVSEDEEIKAAGLILDFDEIAKKGKMSKEESNIAKWYGIYSSRQPGDSMARIVVPGGQITSPQARQIARVAKKYGRGKLNITTRQAIQYHHLQVETLPEMIRDLAEEGLTTFHGCGDVTRNVAACPLAEICKYKRMDVLPIAKESGRYLSSCRDLDNLPRKYKITWSGCGAACAQPYMNCVGLMAVQKGDKTGFKAAIGGGMGWRGFVAQDLFTFIPLDKAIPFTRAVALLFRDHGDRFNRAKARLKFVVHRYGIDKCREIILENLAKENVSTEGFETQPFDETGIPYPARPLTDKETAVTDGKKVVRIMIPKGEFSADQLIKIAEFSELYGNQRIYTTNRQNVELHGVEPEKEAELKNEIEKLGLKTENFFSLDDIVSCVGTTYCPKAVSTTRNLFDLLVPVVGDKKFDSIRDKAVINITGCPNSCSPYRISDIGFRGMRIREEKGSVEGYEMLIGGDQTKHGQKLGNFKAEDCPEVTAGVLETFMANGNAEESLTDCVNRIGIEPFKEAVFK